MSALGRLRRSRGWKRLRGLPGIGPLAGRVAERLAPPGRLEWTKVGGGSARGLELKLDPRFHDLYASGEHEPWLQRVLEERLRPGGSYCDVGAHLGFFSLAAARLVGPEGTVTALEPDPDNFAALRDAVERNGLHQVRPLNLAALDREGSVGFTRSGSRSGRSEGRVVEAGDTSVVVRPLDDVLDRPADVVKIDVEGQELKVLAGALRLLAAGRTTWVVEAHSPSLSEDVEKLLAGAGYEVSRSEALSSEGRFQQYLVGRPRR